MRESWVCLDASFVVALTTHKEREKFASLLDGWLTNRVRLAAPHIFHFEMTNAAYQYRKKGELSAEAVDNILETSLALPLELMDDHDLHREALLLAEDHDLPAAYDAHYLAVASRLGCTLWTNDQRLMRKVDGRSPRLRSPLVDSSPSE